MINSIRIVLPLKLRKWHACCRGCLKRATVFFFLLDCCRVWFVCSKEKNWKWSRNGHHTNTRSHSHIFFFVGLEWRIGFFSICFSIFACAYCTYSTAHIQCNYAGCDWKSTNKWNVIWFISFLRIFECISIRRSTAQQTHDICFILTIFV